MPNPGERIDHRDVARRPVAPVVPTVSLNHFLVTPDTQTYQAIDSSAFLRTTFAPVETRTTVREDTSYTGTYLYGSNTYCEFLDARRDASHSEGDSGVAFGVDAAGGLEAIAAAIPGEFDVRPQLITREYDGRAVPWFYMATPKSFRDERARELRLWVMEYHPQFLVQWRPPGPQAQPGLARRSILERYASTQPHRPDHPLFGDVTALTIALNERSITAMTTLGKAFGYGVTADSGAVRLDGPDASLRLVLSTTRRGIRDMTLRLATKPTQLASYEFGATRLTLRPDGKGRWTF